MANQSDETEESQIKVNSDIPTGSWTLYFHSPEETKWTLNTFVNVGTMKTWYQFWAIMDTLKTETLSEGMFFMMRDPSPPLWESHHHIRGGCYSFRCQKKEAADICVNYMIATMLNIVSHPNNQINGLSISPKRGFNIIKVWNTDAATYNKPSDITELASVHENDIIYTPFVQKKM